MIIKRRSPARKRSRRRHHPTHIHPQTLELLDDPITTPNFRTQAPNSSIISHIPQQSPQLQVEAILPILPVQPQINPILLSPAPAPASVLSPSPAPPPQLTQSPPLFELLPPTTTPSRNRPPLSISTRHRRRRRSSTISCPPPSTPDPRLITPMQNNLRTPTPTTRQRHLSQPHVIVPSTPTPLHARTLIPATPTPTQDHVLVPATPTPTQPGVLVPATPTPIQPRVFVSSTPTPYQSNYDRDHNSPGLMSAQEPVQFMSIPFSSSSAPQSASVAASHSHQSSSRRLSFSRASGSPAVKQAHSDFQPDAECEDEGLLHYSPDVAPAHHESAERVDCDSLPHDLVSKSLCNERRRNSANVVPHNRHCIDNRIHSPEAVNLQDTASHHSIHCTGNDKEGFEAPAEVPNDPPSPSPAPIPGSQLDADPLPSRSSSLLSATPVHASDHQEDRVHSPVPSPPHNHSTDKVIAKKKDSNIDNGSRGGLRCQRERGDVPRHFLASTLEEEEDEEVIKAAPTKKIVIPHLLASSRHIITPPPTSSLAARVRRRRCPGDEVEEITETDPSRHEDGDEESTGNSTKIKKDRRSKRIIACVHAAKRRTMLVEDECGDDERIKDVTEPVEEREGEEGVEIEPDGYESTSTDPPSPSLASGRLDGQHVNNVNVGRGDRLHDTGKSHGRDDGTVYCKGERVRISGGSLFSPGDSGSEKDDDR